MNAIQIFYTPASFGRRCLSAFTDFVCCLLLLVVCYTPFKWAENNMFGSDVGLLHREWNKDTAGPQAELPPALKSEFETYRSMEQAAMWFFLLMLWLYHAGFESSAGMGTPGKRLARIVVTNPDGDRIGFIRASWRFFMKGLVATLVCMAGATGSIAVSFLTESELAVGIAFVVSALACVAFLLAKVDRKKGTIHDGLSRTLVQRRFEDPHIARQF